MENFIIAEEFLNQPKRVQANLIAWWMKNKKAYDLYFEPHIDFDTGNVISFKDEYGQVKYFMVPVNQVRCLGCFPAFREEQLRRIVKDAGYKYIEINNFNKGKWSIQIFKELNQVKADIDCTGESPLDCYWQAVCKYQLHRRLTEVFEN